MKHTKQRKISDSQSSSNIPAFSDRTGLSPKLDQPQPIQLQGHHFNFGNISIFPNTTGVQTQSNPVIQRKLTAPTSTDQDIPIQGKFLDLFRSQATIDKRKQQKIDDNAQLEYARDFERNLGSYLYDHAIAQNAGKIAFEKMQQLITPNKATPDDGLGFFDQGDLDENMKLLYKAYTRNFIQMFQPKLTKKKLQELEAKGIGQNQVKSLRKANKARIDKDSNHDKFDYKDAQKKLKMPVSLNPSVPYQMFLALELLGNPVDLLDFRLTLLGWLLKNHPQKSSYHDIMTAARFFGLPYESGLASYHNIIPLPISELRNNVCLDTEYPGLFPDEIMYVKNKKKYRLTNPNRNDYMDVWTINPPQDPQSQQFLDSFRTTGSIAGEAAVKTYTGGAYALQNTVMSNYPKWIKKQMIKSKIKNQTQLSQLNHLHQNKKISINDLYKETKIHNQMLKNALKEAPLWKGTVYRGESVFFTNTYKLGKTVKYNKFISTSSDQGVAKEFMNASAYNNKMNTPVFLTMNVKYGRDIQALSYEYQEGEILLPPGAEFMVTKCKLKPSKKDDVIGQDIPPELKKIIKKKKPKEPDILYVELDQTSGGEYEQEHQEHQNLDEQPTPKKRSKTSWGPYLGDLSDSENKII